MMNNWDLLSSEAKERIIAKLSLVEKAKRGLLDEYLSIKEISDLVFPFKWPPPIDREERNVWREIKALNEEYQKDLIAACKTGLLTYEGDITGWEYFRDNPHPLAKNGRTKPFVPDPSKSFHYAYPPEQWRELGIKPPQKKTCLPEDCTIHKDEFKRYLESIEKWPVKGLLANWWPESEQTLSDGDKNTMSKGEQELTTWFRETWIKAGRPEGTAFFNCLKKYKGAKNSPILDHWTTGKNGAGIRWTTGNASGERTKKAIQNMVSNFKKESQ